MRYPEAFNVWWNENKNSESLQDSYKNYQIDIQATDEKPLSFKKWALGYWHED
jgi:hypothetical protein